MCHLIIILVDMDSCCNSEPIKKMLIIKSSDMVVDSNGRVRIKRKYGKFTRPVQVFQYNENDIGMVESTPKIEFIVKPPTKRPTFI